jgi:21S rRNA (GM2251-2'-O)-methyltransferase
VAPILAALRAGRRTPHALLLQDGLDTSQRKDGRALADIQRLAAAAGAELRSCSKHDLNMLTDSRPHQGLVLDCSPLVWESLEQLPPAAEVVAQAAATSSDNSDSSSSSSGISYPVWLALDEVTDPQNLGAMVRSAYCLGAAGVLATSKNCAPLSAVVSKASAGAVEVLPLHSCRNMQRTLADAAAKGWAVLGAAAGPDSTPVTQWQVTQPTILVMGECSSLLPLWIVVAQCMGYVLL